ncbi:type I restriction-modification system subunit M [Runella slithyformis]|uniref:site-specific DNA-methyltransferase (adenine-specific) n=1 Tax=Runella slithyformis (strain ATCC 29530 / DSM 19594 / LMG 11500 / NCIMB 11436 / LSU 4) TaxID=761193 RepID=A0A7U3ZMB9_RUNSL|nr:class I SAM-dependent DNA methyltransferase [Runella slithyformis]AEI49865.1 N-6 DNA methylase [Runella slithyformis DSM 19594]
MQGKQLRKLETELWRAADQLRANSKLTASEYSMPVLGLIFLRHAYNRFQKIKVEVEKDLPTHPQRGKRPLNKKDFEAKNAMFLPETAQFDYLVNLPESADIGEAIDDAMKAIEDEYDNLKGVLPRNFSIFSKDLLRELLRIFNKEVLQKAEGDLFGKIYEFFLNKFAMTGAQEGGEFFTPTSLVQTIVNVIEPDHGVVFDPACGSAGMFVQTGYFIESEGLQPAEKVTFYGQEKTDTNTKLAKMNLAVHGLEGNIQEGNTFYEDKHDLVHECDFVMANPPFNVDGVDKAKDAVKKDPRLVLGGQVNLPKNDNANYLWIQYFYNYLKPTGRAGFVMASSASDAGHTEKDIREKLVKTGAVDVMVAIGNNFFYTRSLPCTLWFYDRAKEQNEQQRDKVLMLDARKIYRKVTSKVNDFSPEQLQNLVCIVNLYRGNTAKLEATLRQYLDTTTELAQETAEVTEQLQKTIQAVFETLIGFFESWDSPPAAARIMLAELKNQQADAAEELYQPQNQLIEACNNAGPNTLEAVAHQCRSIRKPQDKFLKELLETIALATKELQLNKNKDWAALKLKDTLDTLKDLQLRLSGNPNEEEPGLLHDTDYYWKQAHWLTSRFPAGVYADVEGLCKVVTQADIAAKDYSLSPGRYVGVDTATDNDEADYEERLREIHLELDGLNEEAVALAKTISENFKELAL